MEMQKGNHTQYDIQYHIVWTTKYRYKILKGRIAERLRILITQGCKARGITIIRGNITPNHVHLLLSCPPTLAPAKIVQYLKGRSSKMLQEEYEELRKKYWGQHLWSIGYFCRSVGTVTEEMIKKYIEDQKDDTLETFKISE